MESPQSSHKAQSREQRYEENAVHYQHSDVKCLDRRLLEYDDRNDDDEYQHHEEEHEQEESEEIESSIVPLPDAVAQPWTVVIELLYAVIAN